MDERLRNWAWYVTWGVVGPQPDSTCRSFEKNYMPELGNLYAESEPTYEPEFFKGSNCMVKRGVTPSVDPRNVKSGSIRQINAKLWPSSMSN